MENKSVLHNLTLQQLVDYYAAIGGEFSQGECDLYIQFDNCELMLSYCVLDDNGKVVKDFDYTPFNSSYDGTHELFLILVHDGAADIDFAETRNGYQLLATVRD